MLLGRMTRKSRNKRALNGWENVFSRTEKIELFAERRDLRFWKDILFVKIINII